MKHTHHNSNIWVLPFILTIYLFSSQVLAATPSLFNNKDLSSISIPFAENAFKQRAVSIDTQLFSTLKASQKDQNIAPDSISISLFDGKSISVLYDKSIHVSKDSVSWVGHIKGKDSSDQVILTINDDIVMGTINQGNDQYQIKYLRHTQDNQVIHLLKHIDPSKTPQEHPDAYPEGVIIDQIQDYIENYQQTNTSTPADPQADDDGSVIDVMVVYTPNSKNAVGGTAAMSTLIDLAVMETNEGYIASGINITINLVHKEEVIYTEASSNAFGTALSHLQNTTDGYMDNVHTLRDTYAADMVSLLIHDTQYCGLGYLNSSAAYAFQVTAHNCATGYYSFAHEFGHNQGAHHDWRVNTTGNHNHGYVNVNSDWRTIMAYNDPACPGGYCTRKKFWSNPDKTYNGEPTGVPEGAYHEADNRKILNASAYTVANFRVSAAPATPHFTSPTPGATLPGTTETFTWDPAGEVVQQWWLYAGSTDGAYDYFVGGNGASYNVTATNLPTDGSTVYIEIWYQVAGNWFQIKTTYTAANIVMTSPTPNSTLSGPIQTFAWNANGATIQQWWFFAGSSEGSSDYFVGGNGASTSVSVTGLPTDGSTVYVHIWYQINGTWAKLSATYTAANIAMSSPTPGSTLTGSSETFTWSITGASVNYWYLTAGSSPGANDYASVVDGSGASSSAFVTDLPTDGSTVYIRIWFQTIGAGWTSLDATYIAAN